MPINVSKYLSRLHLQKEEPTLSFLQKLQYKHLLTFPFENLDIHLGNPITLETEKIFRKMILQGRGGFCYELNGLFYELLKHLNFDVFQVEAQVYKENVFGPIYDHLAIIATIEDERYLVDVGFGDSFKAPKKVDIEDWQIDGNEFYRVRKQHELYFLERSKNMLDSEVQYRTDLRKRQYIEFMQMCQYHQTDPASSFTQNRLVSKLTPNGRVTLKDDELIVTEKGVKQKFKIHHEDEFNAHLETYFAIKV